MPTFEELDRLNSADLHQRAVKLAERRHDIGFLWRLLKAIPEAATIAGDVPEMERDVMHFYLGWLRDFARRDRFDDALRPLYIDYLRQHADG